MEIIGERINTSRKHINKAGADYIDVNAGTSVSGERE